MAISIYYTAERRKLLNAQELALVSAIVRDFSVDQDIEQYLKCGNGLNWESFDISTNTEAGNPFKNGLVITGATKLPDNEENATWIGLQHWCNCLSRLRNAISGCNWKVYVEDHEIQWDKIQKAYDPSR
ncbi:hypothetical protein K6U21_01575 [Vibrio vulnificus]|uniref:hypothetical protein n=1 Tax=Vibrio vulnificus TaxID=672 RepID=UPI001EEA21EA|nr:hypothetical protein [Vibrio vulnificus]MCG6302885.1 hypothetical protein [Vibrio vulnificus]MCG9655745.1 hypothetical protein [Vibrio vulnificus]